MKLRPSLLSVLTGAVLAGSGSLFAAPPAPAAAPAPKPEAPKAVFTIPENPIQGRDPFFPNSMRPYIIKAPTKSASAPSLSDLVVKSILPSGDHAFAIINNHTFAPGDEGTVTVKDGQHMLVRCVSINVDTGTVTVESEGVRAVLRFGNQ